MTEIVVETTTPLETVIEIEGGPVLTTTVAQEVQTVVEQSAETYVIDLNSGARGEPGSAILAGTGMPDMITGSVGDAYVVTEGQGVGTFLIKREDSWEIMGNIRGPAGGIDTINNMIGPHVTIDKYTVGLNNVDNTADLAKPVSTATQSALNLKANDNNVVHTSGGTETIQGLKTFTQDVALAGGSLNVVHPDTSGGWTRGITFKDKTNAANLGGVGILGSADTPTLLYMSHGTEPHLANLGLKILTSGAAVFSHSVTASVFTGSGANLTALNGSNISTGTVSIDRLPVVSSGTSSSTQIVRADDWRLSNAREPTIHVHENIKVDDVRNYAANTTQDPGFMPTPFATRDASVTSQFGYVTGGGTSWRGVLTIKGWAGEYSVFQLIGPASPAPDDDYYLRSGVNATWNTPVKILHSGNLNVNTIVYQSGNQTIAGTKTFSSPVVVPAPTADTHAAHKKYVDDRITALINTSPATLDTLNELAAAIGNDPNFATTMTNQIATKAPLASPTFTGSITAPTITTTSIVGLNMGASYGQNPAGDTGNLKLRLYDDGGNGSKYGFGISSGRLEYNAGQDAARHTFYVNGTQVMDISSTGVITAPSFSGSGAALTALNASNVSAGTLADARLPARLQPVAQTTTDWNNVTANGWYMATGAANAPVASEWLIGEVVVHDASWVTQTVWEFTTQSSTNTKAWRRSKNAGTWTSWYRVTTSQAELDARYQQNYEISSGVLIAQDLVRYSNNSPSMSRYMRVNTKLPTISAAMLRMRISGMTNFSGAGTFDGYLTVYLYNTEGGTLYQPHWSATGMATPAVSVAKDASNNMVVILDRPDWGYPNITVDELIVNNGHPTEAQVAGWTITNHADHAGLTAVAAAETWDVKGVIDTKAPIASPTFTGTISGDGSGLTNLNASNLASGTVPQARMVQNIQRVVFTTAGTARPAGATYVEWMGPVQPANMVTNDTWINTGA